MAKDKKGNQFSKKRRKTHILCRIKKRGYKELKEKFKLLQAENVHRAKTAGVKRRKVTIIRKDD